MKQLKYLSFALAILLLFSACSFTINIGGSDEDEDKVTEELEDNDDSSGIESDNEEEEDKVEDENGPNDDIPNNPPTVEDIKEAFMDKYPDWEEEKIDITINQSTDMHASGGITFFGEMTGGGYFFAANTPDGWVIAADGNGTIDCDDIEPYDFPTSMVPECYDIENQKVILR